MHREYAWLELAAISLILAMAVYWITQREGHKPGAVAEASQLY
jgi:hypothetical protein